MADLLVSITDFALYLDIESEELNSRRAGYILTKAQALCETIVTPLPAGADAVILDVAARAYVNPQQIQDAGVGTGHVQFGSTTNGASVGGLYLSRSNKTTLRNLAGRGSAFSADTLPAGVDAVQTVTVFGATGGTFTLTLGPSTTDPLPFDASAAAIQAALTALAAIGPGNVSVAGVNPWAVKFIARLGTQPIPLMRADGSGLTGGTVAVVTTVPGVAPPGANLAAWDYDYYQSSNLLGTQTYGQL